MKKFLKKGLIVIFLISIFSLSQGVWSSFQKLGSLKKSDSEIAKLKGENERLKKEKAYRQSDFYIESAAREKLGLSKEGEKVYLKNISSSTSADLKEKKLANWQEWLELFTN